MPRTGDDGTGVPATAPASDAATGVGATTAGVLVQTAGLDAGTMLVAMHGGTGEGLRMPLPFSKPICLVEGAHVAGTTHVAGIRKLAAGLSEGDRLRLVRDAGNPHDRWAIRVLDGEGSRLGFVPADQNEVLARLMDGGKRLFGQVTGVEQRGSWTRIGMDVYLDD